MSLSEISTRGQMSTCKISTGEANNVHTRNKLGGGGGGGGGGANVLESFYDYIPVYKI